MSDESEREKVPETRHYRGVVDERLVDLPEPIQDLVDGIADR